MKAGLYITFLFGTLLAACNKGNTSYASDGKFREGVDFVVGDLVACDDIDGGEYLVAPLNQEWTEEEKMFYHLSLNFWDETTAFLWSAPMVIRYMDSGPNAYLQCVAEVLEGQHKNNAEVREFGWRTKFTEDARYNTLAYPPCDSVDFLSNVYDDPDEYNKWQKSLRKCLDIVFGVGDPCCFVVEKPIIRDNAGIVTLKLLESEKSHVFAHLFARLELYFEREGGQWYYAARKVY
jgi:hypothetical protein